MGKGGLYPSGVYGQSFRSRGCSQLWDWWWPRPPPTLRPRGSQSLWGAGGSSSQARGWWSRQGIFAELNECGLSLHIFLTFGKCNVQKSDL